MISPKKFLDKMEKNEEKKVTEEEKRMVLVGLKTTISVMTIIMK